MPVIKQMLQLAGILLKILGTTAGAVINPFVTEGRRLRGGEIAPSSANTHLQELQGAANAKAAAAAEKAAAARAKALLKAQKDNTKQLKQQAATKKQSALFDMEQIQIVAALKGKISKEEELRLRLQVELRLRLRLQLRRKLLSKAIPTMQLPTGLMNSKARSGVSRKKLMQLNFQKIRPRAAIHLWRQWLTSW